jgi:hypothetical protein
VINFAHETAVVNHTIFQTEISALLDSWASNTCSQNVVSTKKYFSLYLRKKNNMPKC